MFSGAKKKYFSQIVMQLFSADTTTPENLKKNRLQKLLLYNDFGYIHGKIYPENKQKLQLLFSQDCFTFVT